VYALDDDSVLYVLSLSVPDELLVGSKNLAPLDEFTHPATQSSRLPLKEVSPDMRIVHHFWGVEAG
jgi:hypothetical protein